MAGHLGRILNNVAAAHERQRLAAMISHPITVIGPFVVPADAFWPAEECGEYMKAKECAGLDRKAPVEGVAFTLNHLFQMPWILPEDYEGKSRFHGYLNMSAYYHSLDTIIRDLESLNIPNLKVLHGDRNDKFHQHGIFVPRTRIEYRDAARQLPYEQNDVLIGPTLLMYLLRKGVLNADNQDHMLSMKAAAPIRAVLLALDDPRAIPDPGLDEIRQRIETEITPLVVLEDDKFPNWLSPMQKRLLAEQNEPR